MQIKEDHPHEYFAESAQRTASTRSVGSRTLGHGGSERLAQITGMNVNTIRRGRRELNDDLAGRPTDRVRKPGGGRPAGKKSPKKTESRKSSTTTSLVQRQMTLSLRTIASRLGAQAYRIGRTTVGRLLRKLGFGLVANRKQELDGRSASRPQPPVWNSSCDTFLRAGYPVISVDTKNKELIQLRQPRSHAQAPEQVNLHECAGSGRAVWHL